LPSSIKAMRHAVNVSESGSIPEAAAISKPLHLGWNRTVDPVSDEFESRWRRQNRPSCGLLHDVTATTGVRVAERRSMQISSMEHVFTRAVGTVASPTHLLESVQSRHRVPVNGLCK